MTRLSPTDLRTPLEQCAPEQPQPAGQMTPAIHDYVTRALAALAAATTPAEYRAAKRLTDRTVPPREQLAMVDAFIEAAYRTGVRRQSRHAAEAHP